MRTLIIIGLTGFVSCGPHLATTLESDPPLTLVSAVPDGGVVAPDAGPLDAGPGCIACTRFGQPVNAGAISEGEIDELSGLAASKLHPGIIYAHNDSGDSSRLFAMTETGVARGQFKLMGNPAAHDWEDIAVGPCPAGSCVFVGDIGDNNQVRDNLAVFRISEPEVTAAADVGTVQVAYDRFAFQYPGGAKHNAETLLVHPMTGVVYVLTKPPSGASEVYRFPMPLDASSTATLVKVADLSVPAAGDSLLTGGDIDPCGQALLLRLYNRLVVLKLPDGQPFEAIFTAAPQGVPVSAAEVQGEAVCWSLDGKSLFTASEGTSQTLHRSDCHP